MSSSLEVGIFDKDWYDAIREEDRGYLDPEEGGSSTSGENDPLVHDLYRDFFRDNGRSYENHLLPTYPSELTQALFRIPNHEGVFGPFSFEGRRHLPHVYDSPARKLLLCCARQVEKCVGRWSMVLTRKGLRFAHEVRVGDQVLSLGKTNKWGWANVVWATETEEKQAVLVKIAGGYELKCGEEHPIWTTRGWVKAGELKKGEWVAMASKLPLGTGPRGVDTQGIVFSAMAMAGTHAADAEFVVRVVCPRTLAFLQETLEMSGYGFHSLRRVPGAKPTLQVVGGTLKGWMRRRKGEGRVPDEVLALGEEGVELFLRVYWGCAGSLESRAYGLEARLFESNEGWAKQLSALHLVLGIPVSVRESRKKGVAHYVLRVGKEGMERLCRLLSPERQPVTPPLPADAQITLPIKNRIRALWLQRSKDKGDPAGWWRKTYRELRSEAVSKEKARELLHQLRQVKGVDPVQLVTLEREVEEELVWRRVVGVQEAGKERMVDFQVDSPSHAFVADGVVTHNSTYLGNKLLLNCLSIPGYKALYVSPSNVQTRTFSKDRLRIPIDTSPVLKTLADQGAQSVHEYVFGNHSQISLRSAFLSADRCRGIASYMLALDEFQDLLPDHLPVILPSLSHAPSKYRFELFTGTPKSFDNNMEYYRSGFNDAQPMSTMGEWMVPCDACGSSAGAGRFWQCLGEANIQKKGLMCARCGKPIHPQHPDALWVHQQADGLYESYRIPQLMIQWRQWGEIYNEYLNYPRAKFYNEILGLSMDDSSRPLTMSEMRACCDDRVDMDKAPRFLPNNWGERVFAGIDWGSGTSSYTVLTLATYVGGIFTVFFIKRFTGQLLDVQEQILHILEELRRYRVDLVGSDFGFGLQYNDTLIRRYGRDKVAVFQHLGRVVKKVWFDPKVGRFKLFRSLVMADFINMIKRKNIRFPRWDQFREPYAKDFCNITSHLSETQQMVIYSHRADKPDDSFHSVLYAFLASCIRIPRPDILTPLHDRYRQGPVQRAADPIDQS